MDERTRKWVGGNTFETEGLLFYIRIFIGQMWSGNAQPSIFGKGREMNAGMENAINLGKCRKKSPEQRKGTDEKAKYWRSAERRRSRR
jgi:hypothetical protein